MSFDVTIALNLFSAVIAAIILYSNVHMFYPDEQKQNSFSLQIALNIICLLTNAAAYWEPVTSHPVLNLVNMAVLSAAFYSLMASFAEYVLLFIGKKDRLIRVLRILIYILAAIGILIWVLPATGLVPEDEYRLFYGQIPGLLIIVLIVFLILRYRSGIGTRNSVFFLIYLAAPLFGMYIRTFFGVVGAQHVGTTISILLIHTILNKDQALKFREQERLNELNKTRIMLTQIKPHFIYNALNTIYYLCGTDPKTAQKAISEFSDYLRGNLDSLTTEEMIPFSKELEHIHHYLYLEKLRFDDELNVACDITCKEFQVPALSIQLLVENAVKHGIGRKEGGGTLTISTSENETSWIVQVRDDGVGFTPDMIEQTDERSHIGLTSMQERIRSAGGSVDIKSALDEGTVVTVTLPKTA